MCCSNPHPHGQADVVPVRGPNPPCSAKSWPEAVLTAIFEDMCLGVYNAEERVRRVRVRGGCECECEVSASASAKSTNELGTGAL